MISRLPILVTLTAVTLAGCAEDRYSVVIDPGNGRVTRSVIAESAAGSPTAQAQFRAEVAPAKDSYQQWRETATRVSMSGDFPDVMPDDIGNTGRVVRLPSDLGEVIIYSEKFRGTDDLAALWQRQSDAAHTVADVLVAWSRSLRDNPQAAQSLTTFCDATLRRDLQNIAMLSFVRNASDAGPKTILRTGLDDLPINPQSSPEFWGQLWSYLTSHGYSLPDSAPFWATTVQGFSEKRTAGTWEIVLTSLARKLRHDGQPAAAALLEPVEHRAASLMTFISEHPAITAPWHSKYNVASAPTSTEPEKPDIPAHFAQVFGEIGGQPLLNHDQLELELRTSGSCLVTNGVKVEHEGVLEKVTWKFRIERARDEGNFPAAVAFAVVAVPDQAAQSRLLKGRKLHSEPLAQYCLGWKALTPEQRAGWTAALAEHGPGAALSRQARAIGIPAEVVDVLHGSFGTK